MNFIRVKKDNRIFYGGAQEWFDSDLKKSMGCGIIAAANSIKCIEAKQTHRTYLDYDEYMALANLLSKKYIHVLPKLGINGISLSVGINRYFWRHRMPYRAVWGIGRRHIWENITRMVNDGIPVILAIGPNNIRFLTDKKLPFYTKDGEGFVCSCEINAHYVSVTAIDDFYLTISSWGRKYYINRNEFINYCKRYSNFLYSNVMIIKNKHN